jgi:hypothetical protein
MTVPFREATRVRLVAEGLFEAEVPDGWQQGRGAFGGLVFGILIRAARATETDPLRVVRSFVSDIAGPVLPGPAHVRARVLRRGKTQTNLHVELEQGGEVLALASLTLSGPRRVEAPPIPVLAPPAEASRDWREAQIIAVGPPFGPVFAPHYEFRNVGPLPLSGGDQAVAAGFVREKPSAGTAAEEGRGAGTLDTSDITALLDSYWPSLFAIAKRPMAMTTISFASQYLHVDGLSADEPLFFRAHAHVQSEGYCVEFRELWARDRLVGLNQQTFAVLR